MKRLLLILGALLLFMNFLPEVKAADEDVISFDEVTDGGEYIEDIELQLHSTLTYFLNGEEVVEDILINQIGYHTIEVYENDVLADTISFTIHPRASEDFTKVDFNDYARVFLENDGDIYINQKLSANGITIREIGYHFIKITGINDYEVEYKITVHNKVLEYLGNVGKIYATVKIDRDVVDHLYFMDKYYNEDLTISDYGNYKIRVLGNYGYDKTYEFALEVNINKLYDGAVFNRAVKIDKKVAQELVIDDVTVDKGYKLLSEVGYHDITYKGLNGYEVTYRILITEPEINLEGKILEKLNLKYEGFNLFLDGKKYNSETEITSIGNYTLVVKGKNGYENDYNFKIWRETELPEEDAQIVEAFNLVADYELIFVNGKKVESGYRITESGFYEVVLWGHDGYTESHNFEYTNLHVNYAQSAMYAVVGFGVLTLALYAVTVWRRFK